MGIEESKIAQEVELSFPGKNIKTIPKNIPTQNAVVQKLNLSNNQLQELPPKLKNLLSLNISYNSFGSIPQMVSSALLTYSKLESLDLSNNSIKTIGNILNQMPSLKQANLFGNMLTSISFNLSKIESIDLGNNLLNKIPTCPDSIISLKLDHNKITSIVFDGACPKLSKLVVSDNQIAEVQPGFVFNSLTTIDLSNNNITTISSFPQCFPNAKQVNLANNKINTFPNFTKSITELYMSSNCLTKIPELITNLTQLTVLNLSHNKIKVIEGPLPTSLQNFYLYDNDIEEISTPLSTHRVLLMNNSLKTFPTFTGNYVCEYYLSNNLLTKLVMSSLSNNVQRLDLTNNQITRLPEEIFSLERLTHLYVGHNKLTSIPETIKNSHIIILNVSDNQILKLPKEYPHTLEQLYLSFCNLTSIPDELKDLPDLVELDISNNQISEIPEIPSLHKLIISMNKFKALPQIMPRMVYLDASYNEISSLPEEFSSGSLKFIDLSFNKLKSLPKSIQFPKLEVLKIQQNPLATQLTPNSYPKIQTIDCSTTNVYFDDIPENRIHLISSEPGLFNSHNQRVVQTNGKVCYTKTKGLKEMNEDPMIIRSEYIKGVDIFALFDSRGAPVISFHIAHKIVKDLLHDKNLFSQETIEKVLDIIQKACKKKHELIKPDMAFTLFKKSEMILTCTGRIKIIRISEKNSQEIKSSEISPYPSDPITLTKSFGPLPSLYNEADEFVFGIKNTPNIIKTRIHHDDKWLLLLSVGVTDVLSQNEIVNAARKCSSASEVAYCIRNMAYANLSSDNLSVVCIDLSKEYKSHK